MPAKTLMARAQAMLARRPYCRAELRRRLEPLAPRDEIESLLDRLEELRLLNDATYAYNFAFYRLGGRGYSPERVRRELEKRGVRASAVESALSSVLAERTEAEILADYLGRRAAKRGLPADRRSIEGLVRHLRRKGFGRETIYRLLREQIPGAAWDSFEPGD